MCSPIPRKKRPRSSSPTVSGANTDDYARHRKRRIHTLLSSATKPYHTANQLLQAASYPEAVALAGLFASERWRALAGSKDIAEREQFCHEVSRRIGETYTFADVHDPIPRWIREQQHLPISPHAVDW